jgi:hypothetical protein
LISPVCEFCGGIALATVNRERRAGDKGRRTRGLTAPETAPEISP